ncbi:Zinc finger protein 768 [Pteropus alecto]|uniref:Zinc finger protein 768 n=1 Tax=Pteropus alecto TaxID=9402 RepID=L5KHC0_PTEAL|nr:Zinc finger protein 768 [Pteropus alecto]
MEREASPWGLEPRDVQSPDEIGSPEGSLKGEGGSAPPRIVSGSGKEGSGPWKG